MEDYYKSRHYGDVCSSGAARLVSDFAELFAAIEDVLYQGRYDVEKQRRILRRKCLYTEDSSDRINAFLRQYVAESRRASPAPRPSHPLAAGKPRLAAYPVALTRQLRNDVARLWRARARLLSHLRQLPQVRRLRKAVRRWSR
jgi:hypothetical protein